MWIEPAPEVLCISNVPQVMDSAHCKRVIYSVLALYYNVIKLAQD
jgi:hypothetical protein